MRAHRLKGCLALLLAAWLPTQAQTVRYVHTDALGSPVAMTDANRNVVQTRQYEPYGKRLNGSNNDRPGYTGHVEDAATGLTYMQQRYYDPSIGAMLSVDPVTAYDQPITNFCRYCYARNNPYRFEDPDGRQSLEGIRLPGGMSSTHIPQNQAEAANWGTAPAVPFNRENFANNMDEISTDMTVMALTATAAGAPEASVVFAGAAELSAVAAVIADYTTERAINAATGGVFRAAKYGLAASDDVAGAAIRMGVETAETVKDVVDVNSDLAPTSRLNSTAPPPPPPPPPPPQVEPR